MSKDEAYIKKHELTEQDLEKLERATISHHCRIEILRFASFMEDILKKNDYKGGWSKGQCTEEYLQCRLVEEMGEYFKLLVTEDVEPSRERKELADIANFCMTLFDRAKG